MQNSVTLWPISASDQDFLFDVFCSARAELIESLDLPDVQKAQLMRIQFQAQIDAYRNQYPNADFDLLMVDGKRAGNLYAQRGPDDFVLIDITLLPEHRNMGIGGTLVRQLLAEARAAGKALNAHVRKGNPAWRLWQRLGFRLVGDDGVYLAIEVSAESAAGNR